MQNESKKTVGKEEVTEILALLMRDEFCGRVSLTERGISLRLIGGNEFTVTVENA